MSSSSLDMHRSTGNLTALVSIPESGLIFSALPLGVLNRKNGIRGICHFLQTTDLNASYPSSNVIDFSRNNLTNHELERIIDALRSNTASVAFDHILAVDLSHNMLRHGTISLDLLSLLDSKFPNLERVDITESGLIINGDNLFFDVIDSTRTRRVEWPRRRGVDKDYDSESDDLFAFEFIDESSADSEWALSGEESDSDSDGDVGGDEMGGFDTLFIVGQDAVGGAYESDEGESRGLASSLELDFYALSLSEEPSTLSSCDEQ